jgi:CheY-like chemotaxis protein
MNILSGLKVLVVEDEGGIALLIEDMLQELGCEITASVAHIARAEEAASTAEIDFAVLDVNLDGKPVFPVAHILRKRLIPFVFSTGYGIGGIPPEFAGNPVVAKPFSIEGLQAAIMDAISLDRTRVERRS